jgi:hypothetical protein
MASFGAPPCVKNHYRPHSDGFDVEYRILVGKRLRKWSREDREDRIVTLRSIFEKWFVRMEGGWK